MGIRVNGKSGLQRDKGTIRAVVDSRIQRNES